jgi:hypothetical protein
VDGWVQALRFRQFEWLFDKECLGNTRCITMKTVTLKIPLGLDAKIRRAIARRKESFSELARRALIREVENHEIDFARLAAPYRGMFRGARDLSTREGYGTKKHR